MSEIYILGGISGHTPILVNDALEWAEWFEKANRHVALTKIGNVTVSTVFLGIDHSWGEGAPILFETMLFQEKISFDYQERYCTWEEAEKGHKKAVKYVKDQCLAK